MEKRIQIPQSLYEMMIGYIYDHYDPADRQRFLAIRDGVERKREAEIRRNLYSAYKTEADSDTREMLRTAYLDKAGVPSHGRWSKLTDELFRKGNFDC